MVGKVLSVIVPAYNMEHLLPRCLDSLVLENEELMHVMEVIIINDGSKDNTSHIAHQYAMNYPDTFIVCDKQNGNYGSCVNKGLAISKGKYIKILDADDYFDNRALVIVLKRLITEESDMVLLDFNTRNENSVVDSWTMDGLNDGRRFLLNEDVAFIKKVKLWLMHNIVYRTDILKANGYVQTEGISYTDTEWVYYPLYFIKDCVYYKINLYQYVVGREGQSMEKNVLTSRIDQIVKVYLGMVDYYKKSKKGNLSKCQDFLIQKHIADTYIFASNVMLRYQDVKSYNKDLMVTIDEELKMFPSIYKETGKIALGKRVKFYYIDYWRKHHDRIENSIMWRLYHYIRNEQ